MEFCNTFKAIQNDTSNPVNAAIAVISAHLPTNELNYELTRLLLDSSGFRANFSKDLVTNSDYKNILKYIEENTLKISATEIPLRNLKYFRRCASFFEQIFYLDWNTFANEGNFDTYFSKLLDHTSMFNSEPLYEISFVLQLKLVTAYLRRIVDGIEQYQSYKPKVFAYATEILKNIVFYKSANCQPLGNAELYEWIKLDDSLVTDENLRSVVWSVKMEKSSVVCHALSIAYSLLRMERLRAKLTLFVTKLVIFLEDLCFTDNRQIFDWICRCCEFIYKHHRERISPEFMGNLLDNLYAEDRRRAKSAAGFWIHSVFNPNCHRTNIRIILQFLKGRRSVDWKALVDSLIDDYPVIVDWRLLVEILLEDDDLPEETKLTSEEKGGLVTLMAHAIEETVTGLPPEHRMSNMEQLNQSTCQGFSINVTETLVPCFWRLFRIEYPHKESIQIMLINIIKFFHFPIVPKNTLKDFVNTCVSLFEEHRQPYSFQVILDVLKLIMGYVQDEEVVELCNSSCLVLQKNYKHELVELINDFFNDPNKYSDLDSNRVKRADGILMRALCINRNMNFPREVAFALPQQILARKIPSYDPAQDIPPYHPVLLSILNVCVRLLSEHTYRAAIDLQEFFEEEQTLPENHAVTLQDIDFAFKQLVIKLIEWYRWPELSVTTFLCVCKISSAIKNWPLDEEPINTLVTKDSQVLIARFVESMVWKVDHRMWPEWDNGTRTFILEGFLNMIEWKILPLMMAYDPITYFKRTDAACAYMEKPLRRFISGMCKVEEEATVVEWLANWLTRVFRVFPETCMDMVSDFVELIYPICKTMQNILYLVALKGINFALRKNKRKGESRPKSNLEFLPVLVKFCECLDQSKRVLLGTFVNEIPFQNEDVTESKNFLKCLKKKPAPRKQEQRSLIADSSSILSSRRSSIATFDEMVFSPVTAPGSNSVLADESDLESGRSSVISWIAVCNQGKQNMPNAFSTPIQNSAAQPEITEGSKEKSPSEPMSSDDSVDILLGTMLKKHQITSSDDYSAVQSPSPVAPVQDTVNIPKNPPIPSAPVMFTFGEDGPDPLIFTRSQELNSQAENTSQVLENVTNLLNIHSEDEPDPLLSTRPQEHDSEPENTPQVLENVNNLLNIHGEDGSDSYLSIRPQELDSEAENTSQVLENVTNLLNIHDEDEPDPLPSARPRELDSETENTPQVLENVNDLLNIQSPTDDEHTAAKSTSVTESSGDFPIDDVLNNISMFSSPKESVDQAESTSQAYGSVNELLRDLEPSIFDELAVAKSPSGSESSGRISDVVKNLQEVSLSNAETESSEWSSSGFDKSPMKKKRRSK